MKAKKTRRELHQLSILYDLELHHDLQRALIDDRRYRSITDWYLTQVKKYIRSRKK